MYACVTYIIRITQVTLNVNVLLHINMFVLGAQIALNAVTICIIRYNISFVFLFINNYITITENMRYKTFSF